MKQVKLAVLAVFAAFTATVSAQDEDNPWAIGFGVNGIDVRAHTTDVGTIAKDYIGFDDLKSNIIPSVSRLTVGKYLEQGFSLQLAGSLNKIKTIETENDVEELYYSVDLMVNYDLNNLIGDTKWFDPYVGLGGAYQVAGDVNEGVIAGQAGFNTWFNDNVGLNFNTAYKHGFADYGRDVFQHSVGLIFKFGGKDTDGDGVFDKNDECPEVAGLKEFKGCPDTDGDGIKDSEDECPEVAGLKEFKGCPDTDKDGVKDGDDACPEVPGLKEFNGCPDTDGDGVSDDKDKCPKEAGAKENNGCPWGDQDKDGFKDNVDKCPAKAGVAPDGCPKQVLTEVKKKELGRYAKAIYFNSGKATFKPGVTEKLDMIVDIMKEFSEVNFSVEGHTDSQGAKKTNQRLSERRAKAVLDYLVSKGIASSRLSSAGFGEEYPIDTNATRAGRANNRRVEIKARK